MLGSISCPSAFFAFLMSKTASIDVNKIQRESMAKKRPGQVLCNASSMLMVNYRSENETYLRPYPKLTIRSLCLGSTLPSLRNRPGLKLSGSG